MKEKEKIELVNWLKNNTRPYNNKQNRKVYNDKWKRLEFLIKNDRIFQGI